MKKWIRRMVVFAVVSGLVLFLLVHFVAPRAIMQPYRHNAQLPLYEVEMVEDSIEISAKDGILLSGLLVGNPNRGAKTIVILLHGIGGCKEYLFEKATFLQQLDIASVFFDGRAHGESGGKYCTFGAHEKNDVVQIVDYLKNKYPEASIGIWGNSLGGAIALQALEIDQRLQFGIIESTFTDMRQIIFDYKKRLLGGFGWRLLSDYAASRAGKIANFDPKSVSPLKSVSRISQPILFAHGEADRKITHRYAEELYAQTASPSKKLVLVPQAGHESLLLYGGHTYQEQVLQFLRERIAEI